MKETVEKALSVPSHLSLRRKSDKTPLSVHDARSVLAEAILDISFRFPDRFPLVALFEHSRPFIVGVAIEVHSAHRFYLVPVLNGVCETPIKCEFTRHIEQLHHIDIHDNLPKS